MSFLRIQSLSKNFDAFQAVKDVDLEVSEGELVVLLGPSGCGKTTTLRMIAGFMPPSEGDILVRDKSLNALPPHNRNMGMVFQSYALFPHLTVAQNIAFGLDMRRIKGREAAARVEEMLALVKLEALGDRYPRQLSGGQQQRVALARALAIRPDVLLLDEPLSNLDATLRASVARDIRLLQQNHGITTIMVTHDQDEAMTMGDRLVVMRGGKIEQAGNQQELYESPATDFVSSFIGKSNSVKGHVEGADFTLHDGTAFKLVNTYPASDAILALRPERIKLLPKGGRVSGIIEMGTYLGAVVEHLVRLAPDITILVRSPSGAPDTHLYAKGEAVGIDWDASSERVFAHGGQILPPITAARNN